MQRDCRPDGWSNFRPRCFLTDGCGETTAAACAFNSCKIGGKAHIHLDGKGRRTPLACARLVGQFFARRAPDMTYSMENGRVRLPDL